MTLKISVRDDVFVADTFGELLNLVRSLVLKSINDYTKIKKVEILNNSAKRGPPDLGIKVRDNFYIRESYGR
jgi:hypothetical protein